MSGKRRTEFAPFTQPLRALALQAHQISGMLDPRVPIRALLERDTTPSAATHFSAATHVSAATHGPTLLGIARITDSELGRFVNERLAPGGLN